MRYKVLVTRVQVAEQFIQATSEEEAAVKVQAEFDRPSGYFESWKTTGSRIDVLEAKRTAIIGPTHLSNERMRPSSRRLMDNLQSHHASDDAG